MAGRDNPYDMQIKLLMIGDSGMLQHIVALFLQIFLFTLIPLSSLLQVLVKHVYSFVMLMTHFLQHSLQPLELTLKLRISKSMGQESSSRLTTLLFESNFLLYLDLGHCRTRAISNNYNFLFSWSSRDLIGL
jgi:hypothetical protein